jgi:hypothetical protein
MTSLDAVDTITDYNLADGDAVDLSALLDAALIGVNPISDYARLTDDGAVRVLQIDQDGGGDTWNTVAVLSPTEPATIKILYDGEEANINFA